MVEQKAECLSFILAGLLVKDLYSILYIIQLTKTLTLIHVLILSIFT